MSARLSAPIVRERKKVLVISNNCFSLSNSNGRTLGNLFVGWPKSDLAQFCVIAQDPNWELCDNYYCLEDKTVLKSFIKCQKAVGRRLLNQQTNNSSNTMRASIGRKTLYKVAARELIWAGVIPIINIVHHSWMVISVVVSLFSAHSHLVLKLASNH